MFEKKSQTTLDVLLRWFDKLPRPEQAAYLGFFANGRSQFTRYEEWSRVHFGKSECENVDWSFWTTTLPERGLFTFQETEDGEAKGMVPLPDGRLRKIYRVEIYPTVLGSALREAWWDRLHAKLEAAD